MEKNISRRKMPSWTGAQKHCMPYDMMPQHMGQHMPHHCMPHQCMPQQMMPEQIMPEQMMPEHIHNHCMPKSCIPCIPQEEVIENVRLAAAYVPWQKMCTLFSPLEALRKGTAFPELYSPYCPGDKMFCKLETICRGDSYDG